MPQLKYFHNALLFQNAIVNREGCMYEPSHTGPAIYPVAEKRKTLQNLDVIEDRVAKTFGIFGKMRPGVGKYFFEIG